MLASNSLDEEHSLKPTTYRTEVATPNANGAWKVVEAETRSTD